MYIILYLITVQSQVILYKFVFEKFAYIPGLLFLTQSPSFSLLNKDLGSRFWCENLCTQTEAEKSLGCFLLHHLPGKSFFFSLIPFQTKTSPTEYPPLYLLCVCLSILLISSYSLQLFLIYWLLALPLDLSLLLFYAIYNVQEESSWIKDICYSYAILQLETDFSVNNTIPGFTV